MRIFQDQQRIAGVQADAENIVADVFDQDILSRLTGSMAIGHNRYATSGRTLLKNTQPFVVEFSHGGRRAQRQISQ